MIAVTQTATRYDLSFPDFDPKARETWAAIRDVKALPGRTFDPTEKVWRIPLSASVEVRQLAEKYGAQIEELAIAGGYSADAAHRIAQLEAQLAAVPRIGDDPPPRGCAVCGAAPMQGCDPQKHGQSVTGSWVPDDPSPAHKAPTLTIEQMIEAVKAAGYRVTRVRRGVRAGRKARRYSLQDGPYSEWHLAMFGVPSAPFALGQTTPYREPANPERYMRLVPLWRKAHHRYARRYVALGAMDWLTRSADKTADRLLGAMQHATDFTAEQDNQAELRRMGRKVTA